MKDSLKIPITFLVGGLCWALTGDRLISAFTVHTAPYLRDHFRSLNDFTFVVITAGVLHFLIKKQQSKLSRSEEEYRQLFDSNPNPMWIFNNKTFHFVAVNNAAIDKYGYSKKRFLTMTIYDIRPREDHERLTTYVLDHRQGIQLAGIWKHIKATGEVFTVSVISHRVMFNNQDCNLVMSTDITELLEKEQKLQVSYEKNKLFNDTLLEIAWSNSHNLRKPLSSIMGLVYLLKDADADERKDILEMLELCTDELDMVLRDNSQKVTDIAMQESY